ncbi:MAG: hypothetical protein IPJ03_17730 [Ignavibacteriales bacterium]|nr:hypothetical protein [Ignavibacteriales bacterium]
MINKKMVSSNYPLGSPAWKYARMLEEKRGHNYQYLSDDQWDKLKRRDTKCGILVETVLKEKMLYNQKHWRMMSP